jgi:zinc transporter 1/2/3
MRDVISADSPYLTRTISYDLFSSQVIATGTEQLSSVEQFDGYPVDAACVLFGILFMVILENVSRGMLSELGAHGDSDQEDAFADQHQSCGGDAAKPTACTTMAALSKRSASHHKPTLKPSPGSQGKDVESLVLQPALTASQLALAARESIEAMVDGSAAAAQVQKQEASGHCDDEHGSIEGASHTHGCVAVNTAANAPLPTMQTQSALRYQITAYMFELACVIHSVLIGVTLGVSVGSRSEVVTLLVVLIFHQGLEGLGLGSTVVRAGFSSLKSALMIGVYSITTPVGIAVGIGASSVYDPESLTAHVVQGVLDSVSGGLLLYIALVQLIAEDFSKTQQGKVWVRVASYFALVIGSAAFCVFALWA